MVMALADPATDVSRIYFRDLAHNGFAKKKLITGCDGDANVNLKLTFGLNPWKGFSIVSANLVASWKFPQSEARCVERCSIEYGRVRATRAQTHR